MSAVSARVGVSALLCDKNLRKKHLKRRSHSVRRPASLRYVLSSGRMPLYRVEAVPSDFDAAEPDVPLFRAPLYRATYSMCTPGPHSCQILSYFVRFRQVLFPSKPVVRAIEVSRAACKDEFRQNPRSHSCRLLILLIYIIYKIPLRNGEL